MILKLHKYSVIFTYIVIFVTAIQSIYFNASSASMLWSNNIEDLSRGLLSLIGIVLLLSLPRISLWFMCLTFSAWLLGLLMVFKMQLDNGSFSYPYEWLGPVLLLSMLISPLTLTNNNVRLLYKK